LTAAKATFAKVETVTVSSIKTDSNRAVGATPLEELAGVFNAGPLATFASATSITINDNGGFSSNSEVIALAEGSVIKLGKNASFAASGAGGNTFAKLEELFIGAGAEVEIDSTALTIAGLKTLTLHDGSSLNAAAGAVTFLVDGTTKTTWGSNVAYDVGLSADAKLKVEITKNAKIITGSKLTLNEGTTLSVAEGATLEVGTGAEINFIGITTVPSGADGGPIKVSGTIELTGDGALVGPKFGADPDADFVKYFTFGDTGKIVLNHGTSLTMGPGGDENTKTVVGMAPSAYTWKAKDQGKDDGAQIIVNKAGLTIEDTGGTAGAEITIAGPKAVILTNQTLTLGTGVSLVLGVEANALVLTGGDENTGAKLAGAGQVVGGTVAEAGRITTITGGWQAIGGATTGIKFFYVSNGSKATTIGLSGGATALKALLGAVITQYAVGTNNLNIAENVTIDLGGTADAKVGEIVLKNNVANNTTSNGKLTLVGTITTGNTPGANQTAGVTLSADGTTVVTNETTYTKVAVAYLIGGTNIKIAATNNPATADTSVAGKIAKLIGAADENLITGGDSTNTVDGSHDGKISSVTNTVADETGA
jgi:hypothetical protein